MKMRDNIGNRSNVPDLEILESGRVIVTECGDWDCSKKPEVKRERKKPYNIGEHKSYSSIVTNGLSEDNPMKKVLGRPSRESVYVKSNIGGTTEEK